MEDAGEYERYEEPYSYEVRDHRVRAARGLQAVDGLTTSAVFDEPAPYAPGGKRRRVTSGAQAAHRPIADASAQGLPSSDWNEPARGRLVQ